MNTLELAEKLKRYKLVSGYAAYCHKAADELLRQHEAIKQLREALTNIESRSSIDSYINVLAKKALKDTEDLA